MPRYGFSLATGRFQPEAALLDYQAAVFDVEQPRVLGDGACLGRRDAQLQPQGRGTGRDGLAGDVRRLVRMRSTMASVSVIVTSGC
jgi:hypothetical protein